MSRTTHVPASASPPRHARAFTMVEVAVAFFILAGLSLTALALLRPDNGDSDVAAKSSIIIALDQQTTAVLTSGVPLSASEMTAVGSVRFVTGPSTDSGAVSVSVNGSLFAAAAKAGSSCWLTRRDFNPLTPAPELWAVASSGACTASRAAELVQPGDGTGLSADRPVQLG